MSQENINEISSPVAELSFSNHIVEKIVDEIIDDNVNNSIDKAENDKYSDNKELGYSRSRSYSKHCSQENSDSEHTIILPKGTYDNTDTETIIFSHGEKQILEYPNI